MGSLNNAALQNATTYGRDNVLAIGKNKLFQLFNLATAGGLSVKYLW